jgi:hypothetical protein
MSFGKNSIEVTRLSIHPHLPDAMNDEQRYVPLRNLIGPFDFPIKHLRRRLQIGNQLLGEFNPYTTDREKASTAFCYKKLQDIMLNIFSKLYAPDPTKTRQIEARHAFCLVRVKDSAVSDDPSDDLRATWMRSRLDLAESYSIIEKFTFFIEVSRREGSDESDAGFKDVDDIVQGMFRNLQGDYPTSDESEQRKRKRSMAIFHSNENNQNPLFHCGSDSCDLAHTFTNPIDYGRVIHAAVEPVSVNFSVDPKMSLGDLAYAPSKIFDAQRIFELTSEEGHPNVERMPHEFIVEIDGVGPCVDLCRGLSFGVLPTQFQPCYFPQIALPDVRRSRGTDLVPVPDDCSMSRSSGIPLDTSVPVLGVSAFDSTREKLAKDLKRLARELSDMPRAEALETRRAWQTRALIVMKSIFHTSANVAQSVRRVIEEWETETEKERRDGSFGIPVANVPLETFSNLDSQQAYVANLYRFSEDVGFFCHHGTFIQMLIDSRFAARKGDGKRPHTVLYGAPGSGKSHCLKMTTKCTQTPLKKIFCNDLDARSNLNWAVPDQTPGGDPKNPDTIQAQIAIVWDEVPASYLGAGDKTGRQGEGQDVVAQMKSMLTKDTLSYSRNVEVLNADGTKGRGLQEQTITNECVFLGGMNRPPIDINSAFMRRILFRACLQFQRADGVTFAEAMATEKKNENNPRTTGWIDALRDNAKLHLLVSAAEHCGIIEGPCMRAWDEISPVFMREVGKITTISDVNDRLLHAEQRLRLLTRMIAVFETYQRDARGGKRIMTFDEIVSKIPEVERRSIAGERLCLAVLSSLEDSIFPLIHRLVVKAVKTKWPRLEPCDESVYEVKGRSVGTYARLPIEQKTTNRPNVRNNETPNKCAARVLIENIGSVIAADSAKYNLEGADELARAAVEELMQVKAPDHPVVVWKEDPEADDRSIVLYFSLERLRNADASVASVVKKLAKNGVTQLMMNPYQFEGNKILPQFPAFVEDGEKTDPLVDDRTFAERCARVFLDPEDRTVVETYHHTRRPDPLATNPRSYPRDFIFEITNAE